jgi:hypothetical protein
VFKVGVSTVLGSVIGLGELSKVLSVRYSIVAHRRGLLQQGELAAPLAGWVQAAIRKNGRVMSET